MPVNRSYTQLVHEVVEELLEFTGTAGVAIGPGSSLGTMRHQELSPKPKDLKLTMANFQTIPHLNPKLVPTKEVVSKENFNYNAKRGDKLVQGQYAKTAEWLRAIMQGEANAQKAKLKAQKDEFNQTAVEHEHELDFQQKKMKLDAQRVAMVDAKKAALKAKYPSNSPNKPKPKR